MPVPRPPLPPVQMFSVGLAEEEGGTKDKKDKDDAGGKEGDTVRAVAPAHDGCKHTHGENAHPLVNTQAETRLSL